MFDVAILTEGRYLAPNDADWYVRNIHIEEGMLIEALAAEGLRAVRADWAAFDGSEARSAVFRSTWDYFHRFDMFSAWLERVSRRTRLFNEAGLIRWNVDKHYLRDLERSGVAIVPTTFIEPGETRPLAALASGECILKPAVGGAGRHTIRFRDAAPHEALFRDLVARETMLLQPFLPSVLTEGEVSLMIVDGAFTHAVRKIGKPGDFRVHDDYGGTVHAHAATPDEIAFAERAVRAVPFDVTYARVDFVRDAAGRPALMELEMVEPELFFRLKPQAARSLARGISRRLVD